MKFYFKIFFVFVLFAFTKSVFAYDVSFEKVLPKVSEIKVGDEILLQLNVTSLKATYNAVEGRVNISQNFEVEKVSTGNSIVSFWVENPVNFSGNEINFSGIIPAGYNFSSGQIFALVLKAKTPGAAKISLSGVNLFKNDGLGTVENSAEKENTFNILDAEKDYVPYKISVKDVTPPEKFSVSLVSEKNIFDGKYSLVFNTSDKGSGVASYDVSEGRDIFKHVSSPYLLENQGLHGKIYVTAYDFEGNSEVERVFVPNRVCVGVYCLNKLHTAIFIFLVIFGSVLWLKKKHLKK